ncbi:hypothetical protein L5515_004906 [Caenorhabditis briggsae]|uniref:SH3 domain-containing protein n=1 Tax=Caenorhabditis briggsae TaxID=6238 RepID=A0AAE9ENV3_CAEBR|nr:hypothetical protein L5515_004906 [Caenorhabditis briggsae]
MMRPKPPVPPPKPSGITSNSNNNGHNENIDTSSFSVSAAKALFEAAKKPEVRNAAVAAAKNPFVRQTAKNVAQDEKARGAVLNAVKDPSGGNKISAAFAVADANRNNPPPPPAHRSGASGGAAPGKLSGAHSAIRSQLENLHLGGSTSNVITPSSTSPSYQSNATSSSSYQSSYTSATSSAPPPPPVPRHTKTTTPSFSNPVISTPHAIAKFDYQPTQSDEMALRVGDTVLLSKKVDAEWFYGENQNSRTYGIVPSSYLDIKIPLKEAFSAPPPRPAASSGSTSSGTNATAIYDYNSTEYGDLNFTAGTQITVTARVNEEWLEGECFGRSGIFPVQFVDCPSLYQVPMKQQNPPSTSFSQPIHINNGSSKQSVTVSYDYDSGVSSDLRLFAGDVITVLEDVDSQWLFAECRGSQGMVPKNFLGPPYGTSPKKSPRGIAEIASAFSPKKAVAIGDYHSEDPKHLYVSRGDQLLIVEDVDEYYFKGKLEAFKTLPAGILPKNIVKLEV